MRYKRPAIVHQERIAAFLWVAKSDGQPAPSDVERKENIVPVTWEATRPEPYARPGITHREPLSALLGGPRSDNLKISDRNLKDHVVAVRWST